eukprot:CAMPEP_0181221560 /NCGR_PEP_ID=MMETSP1096-20121128/29477_1 /TAXON_ID=156174 ORGANISM="Chrysochromulina ericina, Strain CCMP281" /NCGR_SAMPLE_ID=MMETSP1096 /ASSEMBLY_ACC=CAM_ASM_000453 /LENGTH=194 /DNA_ID=CAMNT_0023314221 /DNA_START=67 /DNA_END=651 /DNA_ORIENTATION=-
MAACCSVALSCLHCNSKHLDHMPASHEAASCPSAAAALCSSHVRAAQLRLSLPSCVPPAPTPGPIDDPADPADPAKAATPLASVASHAAIPLLAVGSTSSPDSRLLQPESPPRAASIPSASIPSESIPSESIPSESIPSESIPSQRRDSSTDLGGGDDSPAPACPHPSAVSAGGAAGGGGWIPCAQGSTASAED